MTDRHLTLDLFRAIDRGERSPSDLADVAIAHLFDLCPRCRKEFDAYREEIDLVGSERYDLTVERVRDRVRGLTGEPPLEQQAARQERQARRRLAELLELPAAARCERLRDDPERYAGPVLAALLIEESRDRLPGHPREAAHLTALARAILEHGSHTGYTAELYARALAHGANALRVQGELCRAGELLGQASFLLKAQGGGDRRLRAEVDSLEGSLCRDQRRLHEAEALFYHAATCWAMEGDGVRAARDLVNLGLTLREGRKLERAVEVTLEAADQLDPETEPRLALYARHNLIDFLNDAGRHEEARELIQETAPLYERHGDPLTDLRRLWLEGKIARGLGEQDEAEHALLAVRDGFLGQGIGYDAALVSLDLAFLYAEEGRTRDLQRLAEEIVPVFEAQDVHREAAAALVLFQDAARAERLTLHFLRELAHYLHTARHDPRHAFRTPS